MWHIIKVEKTKTSLLGVCNVVLVVEEDVIVVIVGVVDDVEFELLNPEDFEASSKSNWVSNAQSSPRMASNSKSPDSVFNNKN